MGHTLNSGVLYSIDIFIFHSNTHILLKGIWKLLPVSVKRKKTDSGDGTPVAGKHVSVRLPSLKCKSSFSRGKKRNIFHSLVIAFCAFRDCHVSHVCVFKQKL